MKRFFTEVLWIPLREFWQDFYGMMDNLMVMLFILLVGWLVGRIVRWALHAFLRLIHFDRFAYRIGFSEVLTRAGIRQAPSTVFSFGAYYLLFLIFLVLALQALESSALDALIAELYSYLPRLVAAFLILLAGYLISAFVNRTVLIAAVNANLQFARVLAVASQALAFIFFLAIALEQAGIGQGIVVATFSILFGGAVLALALAFGIGGRDLARSILERRFGKSDEISKPTVEEEDGISHL